MTNEQHLTEFMQSLLAGIHNDDLSRTNPAIYSAMALRDAHIANIVSGLFSIQRKELIEGTSPVCQLYSKIENGIEIGLPDGVMQSCWGFDAMASEDVSKVADIWHYASITHISTTAVWYGQENIVCHYHLPTNEIVVTWPERETTVTIHDISLCHGLVKHPLLKEPMEIALDPQFFTEHVLKPLYSELVGDTTTTFEQPSGERLPAAEGPLTARFDPVRNVLAIDVKADEPYYGKVGTDPVEVVVGQWRFSLKAQTGTKGTLEVISATFAHDLRQYQVWYYNPLLVRDLLKNAHLTFTDAQ